MSHPRRTTFGSCGLRTGRRIVPPPPGPITLQASRRGPGAAASATTGRIEAATIAAAQ